MHPWISSRRNRSMPQAKTRRTFRLLFLLAARRPVPAAGYSPPGYRCRVIAAGYSPLIARCSPPTACRLPPVARCTLPVARCTLHDIIFVLQTSRGALKYNPLIINNILSPLPRGPLFNCWTAQNINEKHADNHPLTNHPAARWLQNSIQLNRLLDCLKLELDDAGKLPFRAKEFVPQIAGHLYPFGRG